MGQFTVYFILVLCFGSYKRSTAEFIIPNLPNKEYVQPGDINLGGIFPISTFDRYLPCGKFLRTTTIMQYIEAMVFAIETINNSSDILPGVKLGYVILDDCKKPTTALSQALRFVPRVSTQQNCREQRSNSTGFLSGNFTENFDVVGVVGTMLSSASIRVADMLGVFHVPQISYSSTSDELRDKAKYPYFFRVVPPDSYQIRAMVELIAHYNWTYISVIHSVGSYGETGVKVLRSLAKERQICIEVDRSTDHDFKEKDYDHVVKDIMAHPRAAVVVVFTGPENARGLLSSAKRLGALGKFIWIGGDAWATRLATFEPDKDIALGAFTLKPYSESSGDFTEYFKTLNVFNRQLNPWFGEFWEKQFSCYLSGTENLCNVNISLSDASYTTLTSVTPVIDAVTTFAIALHNLLKGSCPGVSGAAARECVRGPEFLSYISNVSFTGVNGLVSFDDEGEFIGRYIIEQVQTVNNNFVQSHIATWSAASGKVTFKPTKVDWYLLDFDKSSGSVPDSVCSKPCDAGYVQVPKELICCWECQRCRSNEITIENGTRCEPCPVYYWPEQTTFQTCNKIDPTVLLPREAIALFLLVLSASGTLGTIAVVIFYIRHNNTRLIKASSRELCYLMMFGIFLGYVTVFGLLVPVINRTKCTIVYFGFSLGFTWIYAPLLTRTNRIYRIFNSGKKSTRRPPLASSKAQVAIAASFIVVQVVSSTAFTVFETPQAKLTMPVITEKFVELSCELPRYGLLSFLVYNLLLVILCAAFAFKTRKLPDNFNESRFISMCVYSTLVVWCAFIPTYFTTAMEYYKTVLLSFALIVNATVALGFLCLPKVYATLYIGELSAGQRRRPFGTPGMATLSISQVAPCPSVNQPDTDVSLMPD